MGERGMTVHNFDERLAWGEAASKEPFWMEVFYRAFPTMVDAIHNPTKNQAQYLGIDWWVLLTSGKTLGIDTKSRERCYGDILLEHLSVSTTGALGWIEKDLQIDFLAYGFVPSRKAYLFPWEPLRAAWMRNKAAWWKSADDKRDGFRHIEAPNEGYVTRSIAVPTQILMREVARSLIVSLDE